MISPSLRKLLVWMLLLVVVSEQKCIFDEVQAKARVVRAALNEPRVLQHMESAMRRGNLGEKAPPISTSPEPIRIRTWVVKESSKLLEDEKGRIEAAVEEAVRVVSSLLSVHRVQGPLLLSRDVNRYCKFLWRNSSSANFNKCGRANINYRSETCLEVTIPDEHLAGCDFYLDENSPQRTELRPEGDGLSDTDFLLYLHIQSTDKCRAEPNVSAYASHCRTDAVGRPVAGVVVICRDRLTGANYHHQSTVQTVIHELFHVLGFSKELFNTWTDCSSTSQVGCSPRGKVTHSDGSGQMRIYTPSIISALQTHLKSADPELGGPLENQDAAPGRASSHWESRILQGSIMTAMLGDWSSVRVDSVTLAALQDTGWYTVDLSQAQSLVWGDSEGATFGSLLTCHNKSSTFFCSGSGFGCHFLHLHKGECQTDEYLEGCRVYKPLKNGSECWKKENTLQSPEDDLSGEIFGFDSRCFFSSLSKQNQGQFLFSSSSVNGRCYRHRCTGINRYQIQVSCSEWTDCPTGGSIQIKGYQGSVFCPDRRFCLHSDITPPSDDFSSLPASITSDETPSSAQTLTWFLSSTFAASFCFLAAAIISYRKCCSYRIRIHAAADGHSNL